MARDIAAGDQIESAFYVQNTFLGVGKTGKPWLSVRLIDASGGIDGKVWDDAEQASSDINEGDLLRVSATATAYKDQVQLRLQSYSKATLDEWDPSLFLETPKKPSVELLEELRSVLDTCTSSWARSLTASYFEDQEFMRMFAHSAAAKTIHHAYPTGLLAHTVSMLQLAAATADHYISMGVSLDRDVLLMGVFLHDSGKVFELSSAPGFAYTDEGRLLGHIYQGAALFERKADEFENFPKDKRVALLHCILSHHGELEYGSPRRPKTIEAMILHLIDSLDSKVQTFLDAVERDTSDSAWTPYVHSLQRFLRK